jgi:hypothetical protein
MKSLIFIFDVSDADFDVSVTTERPAEPKTTK